MTRNWMNKWKAGDHCEVRTRSGWTPGIVRKTYRYFAEISVGYGNNRTPVIKAYPQIREVENGTDNQS